MLESGHSRQLRQALEQSNDDRLIRACHLTTHRPADTRELLSALMSFCMNTAFAPRRCELRCESPVSCRHDILMAYHDH